MLLTRQSVVVPDLAQGHSQATNKGIIKSILETCNSNNAADEHAFLVTAYVQLQRIR